VLLEDLPRVPLLGAVCAAAAGRLVP